MVKCFISNGADLVSAHAKFSPSGADRWLKCPGSIVLSDFVPSELIFQSAAAHEGTIAHEALEKYLKGQDISEYHPDIQEACSTIKCWLKLKFDTKRYQKFLESRYKAGSFFGIDDRLLFGTADITFIDWELGELIILDLKYGTKRVNPYQNKQLMIYAIGAYIEHFLNNDDISECTKLTDIRRLRISLGILQPRVSKGYNVWEMNLDKGSDDFKWLKDFRNAVKAAYAKQQTLEQLFAQAGFYAVRDEPINTAQMFKNAGDFIRNKIQWGQYFNYGEHCYFCHAKTQCPAYGQNTLDVFEIDEAGGVISRDVDSYFQDISG